MILAGAPEELAAIGIKPTLRKGNPWTDARIQLLKQLWADGWSAAQICAEIGGDISRCAVIGKVRRCKLAKRKTTFSRPNVMRKKPVHKPKPVNQSARMVTLAELDEWKHCRYPIGQPGTSAFRYCGADKIEDASYCMAHFRLCYRREREA